jgi:hypothetical protein
MVGDSFPSVQQRINLLVNDHSSTKGQTVDYRFSIDTKSLPDFEEILSEKELPALVKTFAIPAEKANLIIKYMTITSFTKKGEYLKSSNVINDDLIYLKQDFHFREMRGFSVFIDLFTIDKDIVHVVTEASFTLLGSGHFEIPETISEAFESSYRNLAQNFDSSYLAGLQFQKPSMLILVNTTILADNPNVVNYVRWKRQLGFDINIVVAADASANDEHQIRQLLITRYNAMTVKPDYLLIIGGSRPANPFRIPNFTYFGLSNSAPYGCDLDYGLMVGDDYFPEMIVGRMSVGLFNDLATVLSKTRYYEAGGLNNGDDWMRRGIVIAGNFAAANEFPTTPRLMSFWIRDKMLEFGYVQVDTLMYDPRFNNNDNSTTQDVIRSLNRSAQIVTYRGWGNVTGWEYPTFQLAHLNQVNNQGRTPVIFSWVCGTGDFNHANTQVSIGEAFMNLGDTSRQNGAVAFVAPNYLHTLTEHNNSIGSGMMWGFFDEGLRILGSVFMRGKIELYNNFPRLIGNNGVVHHYWAYYNILGDPSLNMWHLVPRNMSMTLPEQVSASDNSIVLNVSNVRRGIATASRDGNNFTYARIIDGQAILPLPNTDTGANYLVTISARNFNPIRRNITINNENAGIGLIDKEIISGNFHAGNTSTLQLTLKNFSNETINNVQAVLSSENPFVEIISTNASVSSIAAGQNATIDFSVKLFDNCPDDVDIPFNLRITPTNHDAKFSLVSGGYRFEVITVIPQNELQNIGPGQSGNVSIKLMNTTTVNAENIVGIVHPMTSAVEVTQATLNIGTLNAGAEGTFEFTMSVAADAFVGRNARFAIFYMKDEVEVARSHFNMELGIPDNSAPTGPCSYGYFAYCINDTQWEWAPVYDWVEINPDRGGHGTIISLKDDRTMNVDLPFEFVYYGQTFDKIAINDNGWIAFGGCWQTDFRNWRIPSALGPYNQVAVYWDDLKGKNFIVPGSDPPVYAFVENEIKYWHDVANNRFIVTWDDSYYSSDRAPQTLGHIEFQVILEPREDEEGNPIDGDIIFQYKQLVVPNPSQNSNFVTVGIENATQSDGVLYTYANFFPASATPLQNELAIRFTTRPPDNHVTVREDVMIPKLATLSQNYPNPFNPTTNISFSILNDSNVNLSIYNIRGQRIKTLMNDNLNAGNHVIVWDGTTDSNANASSGIYFYVLETDNDEKEVRRMLLLK